MHHIVHCIDCVPFYVAGNCPLSIDVIPMMWSLTLMKTQCYLQKCQASKTPFFIPIQSYSLAPALFYCIRTTTTYLLLAAVAEPFILCMTCHSTVIRWNPLAWVGVVWALLCLLIHACLSCLLLLRVESGLIHREWIGMVMNMSYYWELCVWTRVIVLYFSRNVNHKIVCNFPYASPSDIWQSAAHLFQLCYFFLFMG